jgi:hypothetical protein
VQWEFPGRLGLDPARYALRRFAGDDVQQVLVIGVTADPPRTRATVVTAAPLAGDPDAWLAGAGDEIVADALAVLTRAVAARRVAAADPCQADPDPTHAVAARVGYGSGEQVAEGRWEDAIELPAPGADRKRRRASAPHDRVAQLLGGHDVALACEELAIRARGDLDRGRGREAALQLDAALRAALAELEGWREHRDIADRLTELAGHREPVAAAAEAALRGGLDDDATGAVRAALERLEAALRARSAPAD